MRYYWNEKRCPEVSSDCQTLSSYLLPKKLSSKTVKDLNDMWEVASTMGAIFPDFIPSSIYFTETPNLRLQDINMHIAWLLQIDHIKRPPIEQVCLHMGANLLRKQIELSVYPTRSQVSGKVLNCTVATGNRGSHYGRTAWASPDLPTHVFSQRGSLAIPCQTQGIGTPPAIRDWIWTVDLGQSFRPFTD